ncbi:MAG: hypothetical protein NTX05_05140 [Fusobacteria bacterium]|nr:hypothetical protein [Fusobacteriota bacterium]
MRIWRLLPTLLDTKGQITLRRGEFLAKCALEGITKCKKIISIENV